MKTKEYLNQAYRLDQRINSDLTELERLRMMSTSISSPSWEEMPGGTRPTEPAFVRCICKIIDLENKINAEIDRLVDLKAEIRKVIEAVPDADEQMVLRYRYIHNYTWERIGTEMMADSRTVRRWHDNALSHVILPENPLTI